MLARYQSGTQTRRVPELAAAEPDAYAEMHPQTARGHGIRGGDEVRLITRRGSVTVRAKLSPGIRMDTVFVPFHWGGASCANALTDAAIDPVSRIPEYKACAVRLERAPARAGAQAALPTPAIP